MLTRSLMISRFFAISLSILGLTAAVALANAPRSATPTSVPDPARDVSVSTTSGEQTAVFAGGCFWGVEAVFEHLKGVSDVVSGYSGGNAATAHYEEVSTGTTGHAESVKVTYDPSQISYGQLLRVYFSVAHDPTELNRQGPDSGTQYRSAIFFTNDTQRQVAQDYIAQLTSAHTFQEPIVTQVVPLTDFYAAEEYHQNFIDHNPNYPYVVINDLPKLAQLRQQFPNLYQ
jgi:peptide-methionine (S)-S-oxide reductase